MPADGEGEPDRCSPRRVAAIALRKPDDRRVWERTILEDVEQRCEPFRVFRALADRFLGLMRAPKDKESAPGFSAWIEDAAHCTVAEVRRFAKGLEHDRTAVEAAMALPWSNGPVEGSVQRLKTIKRQMYG
ncbi:MAG TPA: transposase, partial [Armatimonadota bacterium]